MEAIRRKSHPKPGAGDRLLRFLERGIALRSERAEFEEALRLCDVALSLGLGEAYERKRASLLRMT